MEKTNDTTREQFTMINFKYKNWLVKYWSKNGGLISQAMAAKLLGKTPTRIRQMINENKIKAFAYNDESPLVSFAQIMDIFDEEEEKVNNEHQSYQSEFERREIEALAQQQAEEDEEEYNRYWNSLSPEQQEEFEQLNEYKRQQKIKTHFLQEQIEKLEEEKAQIQIEQQELENR